MTELAFAFRTLSCVLHDMDATLRPLGWATAALGMQAKNVKHSGLFFVRSVHSLFDYNGGWKPGAKGDKRAVAEVNEAIRAINREHQEKCRCWLSA